jgi:hypothetical protein
MIKQAASELVDRFFCQLPLGLESPASFEEDYAENDSLRLEITFSQDGGGASPDAEPYRIHVDRFDFYQLKGDSLSNLRWEWVEPISIGITQEDFEI